jgi:hypothetical protein
MAAVVTVNDVLDGHVVLDLECLDRIYVNGYVPNLQVGGQVASFLTQHLGNPIPSPAILEKIGTGFRRAVRSFAADHEIPVVHFDKDDRKIDVMRPYLAAQAATGRPGVAAIGVAQEFARVFLATKHTGQTTGVWFSFTKADRPSTTAPPATGGSCRCGRWKSRAPWCSTRRAGPAGSLRHWSPTTLTSAARR